MIGFCRLPCHGQKLPPKKRRSCTIRVRGEAAMCHQNQNTMRRASWIWRGFPTVLVIWPTPGLKIVPFGCPNCGVLNTLKNSERNWSLQRSLKAKSLNRETSKLTRPGPYSALRAALPNRLFGGCAKALASNHRASERSLEESTPLPVRSGRLPPAPFVLAEL